MTKLRLPFKVLFFGNDEFSVASLRALRLSTNLLSKLDVVTNEGQNPVVEYSLRHNLQPYRWPYRIRDGAYDIGIAVSFGHLIPQKTIAAFPHGMINVHGSLLPRWRGSSPVSYSILHGDKETGVTIMKIQPKKFDVGEILLQRSCQISENIKTPELLEKLSTIGSSLLITCLENYDKYSEESIQQDSQLATLARKIVPEDGLVNWFKTSDEIYRHFRAFSHAIHLYSFWNNFKIKLLQIEHLIDFDSSKIAAIPKDSNPGYIFYHKRRKMLCIKCLDGWIGVNSVMVSGKKTMSAADFYNGFLSKCKEKCYCDGDI